MVRHPRDSACGADCAGIAVLYLHVTRVTLRREEAQLTDPNAAGRDLAIANCHGPQPLQRVDGTGLPIVALLTEPPPTVA